MEIVIPVAALFAALVFGVYLVTREAPEDLSPNPSAPRHDPTVDHVVR